MTQHEVWVVSEKRDGYWQEHSRYAQEWIADNKAIAAKRDVHVTDTRVYLLRIVRENN